MRADRDPPRLGIDRHKIVLAQCGGIQEAQGEGPERLRHGLDGPPQVDQHVFVRLGFFVYRILLIEIKEGISIDDLVKDEAVVVVDGFGGCICDTSIDEAPNPLGGGHDGLGTGENRFDQFLGLLGVDFLYGGIRVPKVVHPLIVLRATILRSGSVVLDDTIDVSLARLPVLGGHGTRGVQEHKAILVEEVGLGQALLGFLGASVVDADGNASKIRAICGFDHIDQASPKEELECGEEPFPKSHALIKRPI